MSKIEIDMSTMMPSRYFDNKVWWKHLGSCIVNGEVCTSCCKGFLEDSFIFKIKGKKRSCEHLDEKYGCKLHKTSKMKPFNCIVYPTPRDMEDMPHYCNIAWQNEKTKKVIRAGGN